MFAWLQGPGRSLRHPLPGSTNYLGAYNKRGELVRAHEAGFTDLERAELEDGVQDEAVEPDAMRERERVGAAQKTAEKQKKRLPPEKARDMRPFPLNSWFESQSVLSEQLREEIWRRVQQDGTNVRVVSSELGVSMERVAAVVRMKEVEKRWVAEGKPLATPYSRAVLSMLPTTPFDPKSPKVHESINDVRVHPDTKQQVFVPVSESRHFTRKDAGVAFNSSLLPTEARIPHPELVEIEKDRLSGLDNDEIRARAGKRLQKEEEQRQKRQEAKKKHIEDTVKAMNPGKRFTFRFEECNAEAAGKDGRGAKAVGWRYGMPHEDRKKGQVKIPRSVR